jgi:hypothetical protein
VTAAYLYCRVVDSSKGRALVPDDRQSEALLAQVKPGRRVMVKTKTARNPKQHRLLWALAAKIAENHERFQDAEHVVHELKINTGHVSRRQINVPGLGMVFQEWPKSIAYESMPQEEFADWFEKVLAYVAKSIWPGITSAEVRNEIGEMLGDDWWPGQPADRARESV